MIKKENHKTSLENHIFSAYVLEMNFPITKDDGSIEIITGI